MIGQMKYLPANGAWYGLNEIWLKMIYLFRAELAYHQKIFIHVDKHHAYSKIRYYKGTLMAYLLKVIVMKQHIRQCGFRQLEIKEIWNLAGILAAALRPPLSSVPIR